MATQQDEREKLLYHFFYVLFKRKWMIPSLFILTMVLILFFTYLMTPMWEATTLVLVEPNPKKQMILFPDITSPAAPTSQDRQPLARASPGPSGVRPDRATSKGPPDAATCTRCARDVLVAAGR